MAGTRHFSNISMIGFMGTGKSSVGQIVAAQLRFTFVDTDDLIESRTGRTISEIFAQQGEPVFRQLENQLVQELASRTGLVIATGG
ncbi:MAG TPA: shikimate kinase, partial [Verrucomicrobiota bacterium]|nr:shikimate kinase [Verrucomicrobiota bacterium]